MATIDTSIYNAIGRGVRSVAEHNALADQQEAQNQQRLMNALNVQLAQRRMAADDREIADAEAMRGERNQLAAYLATADTKAPNFTSDVMARFPRAGGAFAKDYAATQEKEAQAVKERALTGQATATTEKTKFETAAKQLDLVLQATSAAKDQASYTQALQMLAANGVDVSKEPAQFDPRRVAQAGQMALSQAQRLEQEWKRRGFDLDVQRAAEVARHNKAQEGLTARGQNMADSRSRDANAIAAQGNIIKSETDIRKEFADLPEVKRYKAALPAYNAVASAATRDTPQSDINLVYGLAKLYDPDSVVREGEYATIANSQAIPEWLKGMAQRVGGGGRLTAATKKQIMTEANGRIASYEGEYGGAKGTYEGIVKQRGGDPGRVFTPVGASRPAVQSGTDLGGGFRIK